MEELIEKVQPILESTEISASFSGKISTGKFENESPFFSFKETYSGAMTDQFMLERQKFLNAKCYAHFQEVEQRSVADKIIAQREDIRFYDRKGMKYPSVTSIISWNADFFMKQTDLEQYCSRGTIIHKQSEIFLETGEWVDAKDIPELYTDYIVVTKGSLGLKLDDVDFRGWYKKNPFEYTELESVVYNDELKYAGRCDIIANYDGKLSIMDIKTGSSVDRMKAFKQMSAYAKALDIGIEQMVVIHLNNKTKCGFSAPIVTDEIEKYWGLFQSDRESFTKVFGV